MADFNYQYQPQEKPAASLKERVTRLLNKLNLPKPLRDRGVLLIAGVWAVAILYVATTGITGYLTMTSNLTYELNETSAELSKLQVSHSELSGEYDQCVSGLEECRDSEETCRIDLNTCRKYKQSLEEQVGNMSAMEVEKTKLENQIEEMESERENLVKSYVQTVCCLQQNANPEVKYYQVVDGWVSCSSEKGTEFSC